MQNSDQMGFQSMMTNRRHDLEKSWARTREHLACAEAELLSAPHGDPQAGLNEYHYYLETTTNSNLPLTLLSMRRARGVFLPRSGRQLWRPLRRWDCRAMHSGIAPPSRI